MLFKVYILLRFCVSKKRRETWAAPLGSSHKRCGVYSGGVARPADSCPDDISLDSTEEEDLTKKRE
jgi:hypothetical protein